VDAFELFFLVDYQVALQIVGLTNRDGKTPIVSLVLKSCFEGAAVVR
jgi:hypothetical protein